MWDGVHFLTFIGDADQVGLFPGISPPEVGQAGIVESATHAEAVAIQIESDQGHQQQIELARARELAGPVFVDSEAVEIPVGGGGNWREAKFSFEMPGYDR